MDNSGRIMDDIAGGQWYCFILPRQFPVLQHDRAGCFSGWDSGRQPGQPVVYPARSDFLSEFNPSTHYFRTISTSIPPLNTSLPYFDYVDSNGNVLFNEHYGNAIAVFNPATETMTEYENPTKPTFTGGIAGMLTMALSPQNIPWFTELFTGSVGMVNTSKPVGLSLSVQNNTGNVWKRDSHWKWKQFLSQPFS